MRILNFVMLLWILYKLFIMIVIAIIIAFNVICHSKKCDRGRIKNSQVEQI